MWVAVITAVAAVIGALIGAGSVVWSAKWKAELEEKERNRSRASSVASKDVAAIDEALKLLARTSCVCSLDIVTTLQYDQFMDLVGDSRKWVEEIKPLVQRLCPEEAECLKELVSGVSRFYTDGLSFIQWHEGTCRGDSWPGEPLHRATGRVAGSCHKLERALACARRDVAATLV